MCVKRLSWLCMAVLACAGVWLWAAQQRALGWATWVEKVQVASQPGTDESFVSRLLGRPISVEKPKDAVGKMTPPVPAVAGAEKVLVYCRYPTFEGDVWFAYIFLDRSGRVLAAHVCRS